MKLWLLLFVSVNVAIAQVPQSNHVWVVTEENHTYESVIGNPSMPYYNALAQTYGLATQYYAPRHNSLAALMWLVAGQTVTTDNTTTSCFNVDNIVRQLLARGLTWKSYQRDLPYAGFQGLSSGAYVRRHNPLIDFSDACSPEQKLNSVPYTQLAEDIANHTTPNYAYITPNLDEDAHDGSLAEADQWLQQELAAILALPEFKPGGDGLLFIVWDEGDLGTDNRCSSRLSQNCGGRVATLVIGPQVKRHFQSAIRYTHSNLLRTVCDAMRLPSCPGEGSVAGPMDDFFNRVDINTPPNNAVVASPMRIRASSVNDNPVRAMQIYVDGVLKYLAQTSTLDIALPIATGAHNVVVQSWDTAGGIHKAAISVNVQAQAVVVSSPQPNAIVSSPVSVRADAASVTAMRDMKVYVDDSLQSQVSGNSMNSSLAISSGRHKLRFEATDNQGATVSKGLYVTVAKPSLTILSPAPNASLYSPIQFWAETQDSNRVYAVKVYVDNILVHEFSGTGAKTSLPSLSAGPHHLVFQAWDSAGGIYKKDINLNLLPVNVTISSPANGASLNSPVHVHASVPSIVPVYAMHIYVDGVLAMRADGKIIDAYLRMAAGRHYIVAQAWDQGGGTWTSGVNVTVK
jgi:acid phosphatase